MSVLIWNINAVFLQFLVVLKKPSQPPLLIFPSTCAWKILGLEFDLAILHSGCLFKSQARGMTDEQFILVGYSEAEKTFLIQCWKLKLNAKILDICAISICGLLRCVGFKNTEKVTFPFYRHFELPLTVIQKESKRNSLGSVMRLTDFQAPTDYAPGKITSLFNAVMSDLKLREQSPKQTYKHLI